MIVLLIIFIVAFIAFVIVGAAAHDACASGDRDAMEDMGIDWEDREDYL
jgi:hypothetical protein